MDDNKISGNNDVVVDMGDFDDLEDTVEVVDAEDEELHTDDSGSSSSLPYALGNVCFRSMIYAGLVVCLTGILLWYFRTLQCAFGFIFAGYFIWNALSIRWDYSRGNIVEIPAVCSSVSNNVARNSSRVMFRVDSGTDGEDGEYYEFFMPGLKHANDELQLNAKYMIYFRKSDPKRLLASFQL